MMASSEPPSSSSPCGSVPLPLPACVAAYGIDTTGVRADASAWRRAFNWLSTGFARA